jgi:superfamily II DNA or RNA helicase
VLSEQAAIFKERGLLPFQAQFVEDFVKAGSPSVWELALPPGTGKTLLSIEIARNIARSSTHARVLVLVGSRVLGQQWLERVRREFPYASFVDRRTLLDLEETRLIQETPWPSPALVVMTIDLAKREDVLATLKTARWDLVIADESPLFAGKRADAFMNLISPVNAKRGLILNSLPQTRKYPTAVSVARRTFSMREIVDWDGKPIFETSPLSIRVLEYRRSGAEVALMKAIDDLTAKLRKMSSDQKYQAQSLVRAAASSLFAIDVATRRLRDNLAHTRNLVVHGRSNDTSDSDSLIEGIATEVSEESLVTASVLPSIVEITDTLSAVATILDKLEEIPSDSKLAALVDHVVRPTRSERYWMCIWASYVATASYIFSSLEHRVSVPLHRLSGSSNFSDRESVLTEFRAKGGILITSGPPLEGTSMTFVDECIHYDLPADPRLIDQRLGRFLRVGRSKPFQSVVLKDLENSLTWETAAVLGFALSSTSFGT